MKTVKEATARQISPVTMFKDFFQRFFRQDFPELDACCSRAPESTASVGCLGAQRQEGVSHVFSPFCMCVCKSGGGDLVEGRGGGALSQIFGFVVYQPK